jgi:lipid-binding SYLF domain-containing protein
MHFVNRWDKTNLFGSGLQSERFYRGFCFEASEVILLVMTERGISSSLGNSFKLGRDMGLAAGPGGIGVAAATANLSADLLSFSRSKGLHGDVSPEGAVVAVRTALNEACYERDASPTVILVLCNVRNDTASRLIASVSKSAAGK